MCIHGDTVCLHAYTVCIYVDITYISYVKTLCVHMVTVYPCSDTICIYADTVHAYVVMYVNKDISFIHLDTMCMHCG